MEHEPTTDELFGHNRDNLLHIEALFGLYTDIWCGVADSPIDSPMQELYAAQLSALESSIRSHVQFCLDTNHMLSKQTVPAVPPLA